MIYQPNLDKQDQFISGKRFISLVKIYRVIGRGIQSLSCYIMLLPSNGGVFEE